MEAINASVPRIGLSYEGFKHKSCNYDDRFVSMGNCVLKEHKEKCEARADAATIDSSASKSLVTLSDCL